MSFEIIARCGGGGTTSVPLAWSQFEYSLGIYRFRVLAEVRAWLHLRLHGPRSSARVIARTASTISLA